MEGLWLLGCISGKDMGYTSAARMDECLVLRYHGLVELTTVGFLVSYV